MSVQCCVNGEGLWALSLVYHKITVMLEEISSVSFTEHYLLSLLDGLVG